MCFVLKCMLYLFQTILWSKGVLEVFVQTIGKTIQRCLRYGDETQQQNYSNSVQRIFIRKNQHATIFSYLILATE